MNDALVRPLGLTPLLDSLVERGLDVEVRPGASAPDVVIRGVEQHSARIDPGDLFLAWKGTSFDAHDKADEAERGGAVAAVVERFVDGLTIPQIRVANGRLGAAVASDVLYGSPWRDMHVSAVTGTNGKTTTAQIIRWVMGASQGAVASIGTLGLVDADGEVWEGTESLTTPGPVTVSRWLAQLRAAGVSAVVMEASSHALDQRRLDGLLLDAAVFTNVTQDHLDYHGDFEHYTAAKRRLADLLQPDGVVVRWQDDPAWHGLEGPGGTVTYSAILPAELRALDVKASLEGTRFQLSFRNETTDVALPLVGAFNVENALAASAVALAQGATVAEVAGRLGSTPQIPGRLERVHTDPFEVLIDYAHTPDALERVLRTLRPLTPGRLIVVFGAGGDRDKTKRPRMGAAAARNADFLVVTSDNPRTEDPDEIIDDIIPGIGEADHVRIAARPEAVRYALSAATPGDVVLLAGKGHERYQVVGTEVVHLDERELVEAWREGAS